METLPKNAPPAKRWNPCWLCKKGVLQGKDRQGRTVTVEPCRKGSGDRTLTDPLFEGDPLLVVSVKAGSYREHRCIEDRAHSAASFEGKRKGPELPNISYRTSGPSAGKAGK